MKDNFSRQSDKYAQYRPVYPQELYDVIFSKVKNTGTAWDCGTGTGQVAQELAKSFDEVYATDISQPQLDEAVKSPNIHYSKQPAEQTNFEDHSFDLVVVAQAIHWFDFDAFYREVNRTLKPGGIIAVIGYCLVQINDAVDPLVSRFYSETVGSYWDDERKYLDEAYQTIPFPFEELEIPAMSIRVDWTLEHFTGYLRTWSAVKHFIKDKGFDPVDTLEAELKKVWGGEGPKTVSFPVLTRIGVKK